VKKESKQKQISTYLKNNPSHSARQVAKLFNTGIGYVYTCKSKAGLTKPKLQRIDTATASAITDVLSATSAAYKKATKEGVVEGSFDLSINITSSKGDTLVVSMVEARELYSALKPVVEGV
jgi:hypothetical protein